MLDYVYSEGELFYAAQFSDFGEPPEIWQRVYRAATGIDFLYVAATGVLFLAAVRPWSRAEGSWMLLCGMVLAGVSLALGLMAGVLITATEDREFISDLRVQDVWLDLSSTFGFLSIGFFFLAYRGLSSDEPPTAPIEPPTSDV